MLALNCRLLPFTCADGPHNMAADEVLLEAAAAGTASLRLYGWSPPTLSLGYFQPERLRQTEPQLASLPYVRRPSGGATLVHHHEVTYALALPAGNPWQSGESWLCRMHGLIASVLRKFGVSGRLHQKGEHEGRVDLLCFQHFTPGDLRIGQAKVVGSAQRRQRGALLQHGGILLAGSPYTPALPGIFEVTGKLLTVEDLCSALPAALARQLGWAFVNADWTEAERLRIEELAVQKYGSEKWNEKR